MNRLMHIVKSLAFDMLEFSRTMLVPEGHLVIGDPVRPGCESKTLIKLYRIIERGKYVRTQEELSGLLARLHGSQVTQKECHGVGPFPIGSFTIVSNFAVFLLRPCISETRLEAGNDELQSLC
jgi:hypothetical protein